MIKEGWDFEGWATKNDLRCDDKRIIRKDAFKTNDGKKVPLVWNHVHNSVGTVLGHAVLQNRKEGVYAYCYLNNSEAGKAAKEAVQHGDVESLSIYANNLQQLGNEVLHGVIREVSLVLAGANPGAFIESVMQHNSPMEDGDEEGLFYTGDPIVLPEDDELKHASSDNNEESEEKPDDDKTIGDILETLNDEQKAGVALFASELAKAAVDEALDKKGDDNEMRHNIFENDNKNDYEVLSHSVRVKIISDMKKTGSLKEAIFANIEDGTLEHGMTIGDLNAVISHALDTTGMTVATENQNYGVNGVSMLLPDYKNVTSGPPELISRDMTWVTILMSKIKNVPFTRIKSLFADITEEEARAKGYIKGKQKKEEVLSTLKRTTDPQTIYKKQKLDRDDILDITDFDIVSWLKNEMKLMIAEELAKAILIGDGRQADAEDKIQEIHIRPVVTDVPLFNTIIKVSVPANATEEVIAKAIIDAIIRGRKKFKGTGKPDLWTTDDYVTEMLLIEDAVGHKLYKSESELATTLRVDKIIPVEPMEGKNVTVDGIERPLIGTMVNMRDYAVGTDRRFDENQIMEGFDIDFNQHKYLMEKRKSGALIKPFSAVTFVLDKENG